MLLLRIYNWVYAAQFSGGQFIRKFIHSGGNQQRKKTKIGQSIHVPFKLRRTHTEPPRTLCTHSTDGFLGGILLAILEIAWVFYDFFYFVCDYPEFWTKIKLKSKPFGADLFDSVRRRISIIKKQCKAFSPFKQIDFNLCQERRGVTLCLHCVHSAEAHTLTLVKLPSHSASLCWVCVCLCVRVGLRICGLCGFFLNASHVYN